MATIAVNSDCLAVTCGQRVLALHMKEAELHVLEPPDTLKREAKSEKEDNRSVESKQANVCVMGVCLSRCNKWLAISTSDKQLCLWNAVSWSLVNSRHLARAADKIIFSPRSDNIIVADKSGDVYLFSVRDPQKEGLLLLGHLSMLLDVLVSDDERYIITCDRDEKIRVSHFPNAYNIMSYCLGHTEFVSCLTFLPHNKDILVSGSGDGSLKFWDYVPGKLIDEISCQQLVANHSDSKVLTVTTHDKSDMCTGDNSNVDSEAISAVMHVSCCIANTTSILAVSLAHFKGCLIYKVTGDRSNLSSSFVEVVFFQAEPWEFHLSQEGVLWYLSCKKSEPLSAEYFDESGKITSSKDYSERITRALSLVNSHSEWFTRTTISERMCILYKRKFDNVQEYLEKKKMRLSS